MIKIKCNSCGQVLDIQDGEDVVVCSSCGTKQMLVTQVIQEPVTQSNSESLLKRAKIFLEDKEWDNVREYCEKVLDLNPECGDAYALKFLASKRMNSVEALKETFKNKIENIPASKFTISQNKKHINNMLSKYVIPNYLTAQEIEKYYQEELTFYSKANVLSKPLSSEEQYWNTNDFSKVVKYNNGELSESLIKAKQENFDFITSLIEKEKEDYNFKLEETKQKFADLVKKSDEEVLELYNKALEKKNADLKEVERKESERVEGIYVQANLLFETDQIKDLKKAKGMFMTIADYKDSAEKIVSCDARVNELKAIAKANKKAKRVKFFKRVLAVILTIAILGATGFVVTKVVIYENKYKDAIALGNDGKYEEAIVLFTELGGYRDSDELLVDLRYDYAVSLYNRGIKLKALSQLNEIKDVDDNAKRMYNTVYNELVKQYGKKTLERILGE